MHDPLLMAEYRIYSRISREILDVFSDNFLQFDLYTGHKKWRPKSLPIIFFYFLLHIIDDLDHLEFWNFGHIFRFIFSIRLILGSTYTRVYSVTLLTHNMCAKCWWIQSLAFICRIWQDCWFAKGFFFLFFGIHSFWSLSLARYLTTKTSRVLFNFQFHFHQDVSWKKLVFC